MLSEVSQIEKYKYHINYFIYMWNLKNKVNKWNRNTLIDTEDKLIVARWEGIWGLGEKGEGIKEYKLAITNSPGGVQYSLGNIVYNTVITIYGVRWVQDLLGG